MYVNSYAGCDKDRSYSPDFLSLLFWKKRDTLTMQDKYVSSFPNREKYLDTAIILDAVVDLEFWFSIHLALATGPNARFRIARRGPQRNEGTPDRSRYGSLSRYHNELWNKIWGCNESKEETFYVEWRLGDWCSWFQ